MTTPNDRQNTPSADSFPTAPILAEIDLRLRQMARREARSGSTLGLTTIATKNATESMVAVQLGVHQRTIARLRAQKGPLDEWQADEWAIRLGKHPAELWPSWYDGESDGERRCPKGHPKVVRPNGDVVCPTCANESTAAYKARRKAAA